MRTTILAKSTLNVSVISLGTTGLGTTLNLEESYRLLDAYLDAGGNFIDSAAVYSDWVPGEKSRVEKLLGGWLMARKNRDKVIIGTKGGHPDLKTMHISRLSDADIDHDLHASLHHLRTDVIDLYWLHRDDPSRPVAEIIDTLNRHINAGKIRCLGASNWQTERIRAANSYAEQSGQQGFIGNQMLWNVGVPEINAIPDKTTVAMDETMWRYHKQSALAAIPYTAQAGGFFNKVAQGRLDPQSHLAKVYGGNTNQKIAKTVKQVAAEQGLTITQVVLGYLLAQPFVTVPIVGCKSIAQLNDSLAAADVHLSTTTLAALQQARGW